MPPRRAARSCSAAGARPGTFLWRTGCAAQTTVSRLGKAAEAVKINSTKSMVGHLLGAAGAVEFVTCVKEIQEGYIHRTVGLRETEEELDLNYCRDSYKEEVPYALTNSLGFGGHNASLLLKKYTE